jgi:hypothetical protein
VIASGKTMALVVLSLGIIILPGCARAISTAGATSSGSYNSSIPAPASSAGPSLNATTVTGTSKISFTLVAGVSDSGGAILINPVSQDGTYPAGTVVTLTAITDQDHAFNNWEGDVASIKQTITIVMDSNKNITAYFIPM